MAPLKTVRIRNASNQWFDRDVIETLSIRDKLFEFSSSHLNIDWEIYKQATKHSNETDVIIVTFKQNTLKQR